MNITEGQTKRIGLRIRIVVRKLVEQNMAHHLKFSGDRIGTATSICVTTQAMIMIQTCPTHAKKALNLAHTSFSDHICIMYMGADPLLNVLHTSNLSVMCLLWLTVV